MKNFLLHIALILLSSQVFSQEGSVSLSQNSILIGENITLTYRITLQKNTTFKFIPKQNILPSYRKSKTGILSSATSDDIEILSPFHDTVFTMKDSKIWIGIYQITAWDSGTFVLENSSILIDDSTFFFPNIELTASLVKAKQGQDIYDIKESFAEIPNEPFSIKKFAKNNWWWLSLIAISLVVYLIYKRFKTLNKQIPVFKELSLKDRTLIAIDALEKERLWEKNKVKEHFVELSFILRSYLSSRFEINLLEKTTHETKLLLQQKGLHDETIIVIISILFESDMVKFAKSQPDEISVLKISQLARQVVAETSPIEFENAE